MVVNPMRFQRVNIKFYVISVLFTTNHHFHVLMRTELFSSNLF